MQMADELNLEYRVYPPSGYDYHVFPFGARGGSGIGTIPASLDPLVALNDMPMVLSSSDGNTSVMAAPANPHGLLPAEPGQLLKYSVPISVDWSYPEVQILMDGLEKYADERTLMKYIKIAAVLPDKTVRDVAMRCQWMARRASAKRRKPEETDYSSKDLKDNKFTAKNSYHAKSRPQRQDHRVGVSLNSEVAHSGDQFLGEVCRMLKENEGLLIRIAANIDTGQIQSNHGLFDCVRRNIAAIVSRMRQMPGIMNKMPPLRADMNEQLIDQIHRPAIIDRGSDSRSWLKVKEQYGW